jgi:hypothetical protein
MDVYILDPLLRRDTLVDQYISLIWTERFAETGDFELVLISTVDNRRLFKTGVQLATNVSYRVMTVETVEATTDSDGRAVITVKGLSLENILNDRVAFGVLDDTTTVPKWVLTGTPGDVARQIFHDICVTGILDPGDVIPMVIEGTIMPDDTLPEPIDPVTVSLDPTTVYNAIKTICDTYDLGFRLLRNLDTSQLYFDIYPGSDRTTRQTDLPAIVFAPELDTLQNTSELTSISLYKNCAYVFSPAGFEIVYPLDVDPETAGFERHVLMVNADDITEDNPDVSAALIQRGNEQLALNRSFSAFDGEINQNNQFRYGFDYYLGDLVELRNVDGASNSMRVTEQIFVCDSEGERSYPTLAVALFIDTGSWLSWMASQVWADVDPDLNWEDA